MRIPFDLKLVCLAILFYAVMYTTEVDYTTAPYILRAVESFNVTKTELMKYFKDPDLIQKWVEAVPSVEQVDPEPFDVGKVFQATFKNGEKIQLYVSKYIDDGAIAYETNLYFPRPRIEILITDGSSADRSNEQSSKVRIVLMFMRKSYLFQNTVGLFFRITFHKKFRKSVENLKMIVNAEHH